MSEENVRIVQRAHDLLAVAYRDGEMPQALIDLCSPEIRIDASRRVFNPDVYDGHDGLRRLIREIFEAWEGFTESNQRLVDTADRVVALQTVSGRGRASGVEVAQAGAVVWTLRDGLVVRADIFLDQEGALALAGLG
jgi:ketosteroid isomerase-like protein